MFPTSAVSTPVGADHEVCGVYCSVTRHQGDEGHAENSRPHEINRCIRGSNAIITPIHCGEEGAEQKLLIYWLHSPSRPSLIYWLIDPGVWP